MVDRRPKQPARKVISLFSGAMGLDLGLEAAGLEIAVALECNKYALETIRQNRPDLPLIDRRIEYVGTGEILSAGGLQVGEAFAVVGGPSCQVFSTAGNRQSLGDPRSTMFKHFVRVIEEAQPQFFIMENVRGLISAAVRHRPLKERGPGYPQLDEDEQLGSAFRVVADTLRDLGYYVIFDVLNSADFSVPQTRQRLILLGSRDGKRLGMPTRTHSSSGTDGLPKWRTLTDAIDGLNETDPDYYKFCPGKEKYLKLIPEGQNWRSLPEELKEMALGKAYTSWGGRSGFFRRLAWDKPSPALTTRPDSKATTLCHPTELRPLSVGEYARIQQFPDGWSFEGPVRKKYEQVGNAVPIGLGKAVGEALLQAHRTRRDPSRLGHIVCFNLSLLASLTRRPKTIVNPPRMRDDTDEQTLSGWHGDMSRMRDDAFDYAPPNMLGRLREMIARKPKGPKRKADGAATAEAGEGTRGDQETERSLWLTAAE